MGVRGLQTFMSRDVPNGIRVVNIIQEAKQWKR